MTINCVFCHAVREIVEDCLVFARTQVGGTCYRMWPSIAKTSLSNFLFPAKKEDTRACVFCMAETLVYHRWFHFLEAYDGPIQKPCGKNSNDRLIRSAHALDSSTMSTSSDRCTSLHRASQKLRPGKDRFSFGLRSWRKWCVLVCNCPHSHNCQFQIEKKWLY